jgi:hypothetical protein
MYIVAKALWTGEYNEIKCLGRYLDDFLILTVEGFYLFVLNAFTGYIYNLRYPVFFDKEKKKSVKDGRKRPWSRVFKMIFGSHPNCFFRFFVPTFHTEFDEILS